MSRVTSITLDDGLYTLLRDRARFNRRSLSNEIVYLIECALAVKTETNREFIHLLSQLQNTQALPEESEAG